MRLRRFLPGFFLAVTLTACIQDEAPNKEAAIDAVTGDDVQLANINANSKQISVYVQQGADLSSQVLAFTLSDNASIRANESYAGDTEFTFNESSQTYDATLNFSETDTRTLTVTSEDGASSPQYTVTLTLSELPTSYHFERLLDDPEVPYDVFYEIEPGTGADGVSKVLQWSSGNPGYELTAMAQSRTDYPTVQSPDGYTGMCAKLETKGTGSFGEMVGMHIAAGNLFIGSFDLTNALNNAPKATHFGYPFYRHPVRLTGYFKYQAGDVFTEGGEVAEGKQDRFDIYAMLYEASDNSFTLDGENGLTHSSIVLLARIDEADAIETDAWTEFDIPFEARNGKTIDEQKLQDGKYKLGIVFSSSVDGAYFNGAVGSTLYIDEVRLICQED